MNLDKLGWLAVAYTLAVEVGNRRAACRFAIAEARRDPTSADVWRRRAAAAFALRHGGSA